MSNLLPDIKFKAKFLDQELIQFQARKAKADKSWGNAPEREYMLGTKKAASFYRSAPEILKLAINQQQLIQSLILILDDKQQLTRRMG
jgi:hypothetical protein